MYLADNNAISDTYTLHGGVFILLLEAISKSVPEIKYSIDFCETKSKYKIIFSCEEWKNQKKVIGLFLKHSQKIISPWRFTFTKSHQEEIKDLEQNCDQTFILLITNKEGVALINQNLYKKLLNNRIDESEWISVSRKHNENFRIWSKDKPKKDTLAKNCFPNLIIEFLIKN